jgi:hypothetical protein
LPPIPPNANNPYDGAQKTAAARAGLQRALDNYKTGHLDLPISNAEPDISRSDTRSFGETHASELSSIGSSTSLPLSAHSEEPPASHHGATKPASVSSAIDPQQLNQTPTTFPVPASNTQNIAPPAPIVSTSPAVHTVAETGVPQSAGPEGPGPSSGSLKSIRSPTTPDEHGGSTYGISKPATGSDLYESAEEEKKRLEREGLERARGTSGSNSTHQNNPFESAEEVEASKPQHYERSRPEDDGEELPPYEEGL